jgi:hypothetical protein
MSANVIGNLVVPFLLFVILAGWNGLEGGSGEVLKGFTISYKMILGVALAVILAFLITGQAQMLIGRHMAKVLEFLNGKHGVWGSAGAGILAPQLTVYPEAEKLWRGGAASLGVIFTIVLATRLLNFQSVLFFLPFLGWNLTLMFGGVSVVIIILFGCLAKALG